MDDERLEVVAALGLSLTNHTTTANDDGEPSRRVIATAAELTRHLQGGDR